MASDTEVGSLIRQAISDPGALTERRKLHEGWAGPEYESVPQWGARAVVAALEANGMTVVASAEVDRLKKLVTLLQNSGDRIGYAVVTYNQASHWPEFDYADLHTDLEDAVNERDRKREETARIGRHERHVVAEVAELEENDDA